MHDRIKDLQQNLQGEHKQHDDHKHHENDDNDHIH